MLKHLKREMVRQAVEGSEAGITMSMQMILRATACGFAFGSVHQKGPVES